MFRKTVLIGLLVSVVAAPAFAEGSSKEESTAMGLGAVIGGFVGGPPGVIIGAAFGAKIGEEFHERNQEVDSLSTSLNSSQVQVESLVSDIRSLNGEILSINGELQQAREMANPDALALLEAGIEMDLLFRTDEYVLADSTDGRLSQLAATLSGNPGIQIRLDGFADERDQDQRSRYRRERRDA